MPETQQMEECADCDDFSDFSVKSDFDVCR